MNEKIILQALKKLHESRGSKRNFSQTLDLILNLKNFDAKREKVDAFVVFPHGFDEKKVCIFAEKLLPGMDKFNEVVTKDKFALYDKKKTKELVKRNDFFVSLAALMPAVASSFGKVLGSAGKMPLPAIGCIVTETSEKSLLELLVKLKKAVRLRSKGELSVKVAVGKENMSDSEVAANSMAVYNALVSALPKGKENLKKVLLKFTMSRPVEVGESKLK